MVLWIPAWIPRPWIPPRPTPETADAPVTIHRKCRTTDEWIPHFAVTSTVTAGLKTSVSVVTSLETTALETADPVPAWLRTTFVRTGCPKSKTRHWGGSLLSGSSRQVEPNTSLTTPRAATRSPLQEPAIHPVGLRSSSTAQTTMPIMPSVRALEANRVRK